MIKQWCKNAALPSVSIVWIAGVWAMLYVGIQKGSVLAFVGVFAWAVISVAALIMRERLMERTPIPMITKRDCAAVGVPVSTTNARGVQVNKPVNFVLIASGRYRHQFTEELATALRESVKAHMAAYGVTDACCSIKVNLSLVAQHKAEDEAIAPMRATQEVEDGS